MFAPSLGGYAGVLDMVSQLPGVQNAIDSIKAYMGEFLGLPRRITAAMDKADRLKRLAQDKGDNTATAKVVASASALSNLRVQYAKAETKVKWLLDQLKAAGFGVLPVAVALAAVTIAGTVVYLIKSVSYQERLLADVEKGLVPASALGAGGWAGALGSIGGALPWVAGAVVVAVVVPRFMRRKGKA